MSKLQNLNSQFWEIIVRIPRKKSTERCKLKKKKEQEVKIARCKSQICEMNSNYLFIILFLNP